MLITRTPSRLTGRAHKITGATVDLWTGIFLFIMLCGNLPLVTPCNYATVIFYICSLRAYIRNAVDLIYFMTQAIVVSITIGIRNNKRRKGDST